MLRVDGGRGERRESQKACIRSVVHKRMRVVKEGELCVLSGRICWPLSAASCLYHLCACLCVCVSVCLYVCMSVCVIQQEATIKPVLC